MALGLAEPLDDDKTRIVSAVPAAGLSRGRDERWGGETRKKSLDGLAIAYENFRGGNTMNMKSALRTLVAVAGFSLLGGSALADIQDPPGNDYGPTRKLGRGLANVMFGSSEIFVQPSRVNYYEGNSAAFSYGAVKGFGRFFVRLGTGLHEVFTFPFATHRGTYKPPYRSELPWIHGGYEEFPPELGFNSHYRYTREYESGW